MPISQVPFAGISNPVNFRNRIINGDMQIDQRNSGSSVSVDGGAVYTLDRFLCQDNTDGSFSIQQSTTAPTYFKNSMVATITGTDSSLTTTQFGRIVQRIEGFNTADLGWGTANAKTVTLSFWVRSSVTGTFSGTLVNNDGNRVYAFTYTINAANTWEYETITIAGDTTGTWLTTNGMGIELNLSIGAGPDRSVTAGSWGTSLAYAATGQTNLFATSGATFYITGVQLEAGEQASGFEFLPIDVNLARCQRYCVVISKAVSDSRIFGFNYNASAALARANFPVQTRVAASGIIVTTAASTFTLFQNNGSAVISSITFDAGDTYGANVNVGATVVANAGCILSLQSSGNKIEFTGMEL